MSHETSPVARRPLHPVKGRSGAPPRCRRAPSGFASSLEPLTHASTRSFGAGAPFGLSPKGVVKSGKGQPVTTNCRNCDQEIKYVGAGVYVNAYGIPTVWCPPPNHGKTHQPAPLPDAPTDEERR
jgi:hypothetical protein